ncbi:hypothetical protein PENSUB_2780 [Penicillium subrubescens]|uniref:Calcineurin-like phosphoesterase domain-containing protein n=1 Tax=Penicillium subrubescens TaxID=1316194 RepID=A0A1Q5UGT9_9EURO|nr:hypothetical protein PENSUB_2780 [Penicillium subrubescens]
MIREKGDILIHAGDLTAKGTFDEIQAQLRWLSSQPHRHKIVIAGNHDILLDEDCDAKFVTRLEDGVHQRKNLDWVDIQYLQDEAITVSIPIQITDDEISQQQGQVRKIKIYGSPSTPECGTWAFQYPAIRDVWTGRVPDDTDILVVHGLPALYGDCDGETETSGEVRVKGDGYLLREIWRVRPKMVVCGHIHGAFGVSVVRHDRVQDAVDGLRMRWPEHGVLGALQRVFWSGIGTVRGVDSLKETVVVNAAFAGGAFETEDKGAIAIDFR